MVNSYPRDSMSGPFVSIPYGASPYFTGVDYKGFKIAQTRDYFLYEIQSLDRKPVPHELIGRYTKPERAQTAIDDFLERTNPKNENTNTPHDRQQWKAHSESTPS